MIAGFVVHLFSYIAVCGMLVVIWALGDTGSFSDLRGFVEDPETVDASFWPVWVIVTWGAAVLVHVGFVLAFGVFGRKRRKRRRLRGDDVAEHARRAGEVGAQAVQGVATGWNEVTRVAREARRRQKGSGDWRDWVTSTSSGPERRWVTVMFTDIVNSTQLTEALGDDQWSRILRSHRELVRQAIVGRGGHEVTTQGDGFMARFEAPADAVLCAVDIQRSIAERESDDAVVPAVRIGVHAGEAVEDDGDLVGQVVNLASRVAGEAGPGEILVTEPVADYLGRRLSFQDRGIRSLKGISQPRHLLAVLWDDQETAVVDGEDAQTVDAQPAETPAD